VALESQTMSVLFCVSFVNAPDRILSLKGTDPSVVEVGITPWLIVSTQVSVYILGHIFKK
jgi:hypothetical protein